MTLPRGVTQALHALLPAADTMHFRPSSGGCINAGGEIVTTDGSYFIKWNDAASFPGMFEAEAKGLALLRAANALHVPAVVGHYDDGRLQVLVLQFIRQGARSKNFAVAMGRRLAALHGNSTPLFGLNHSNYIGSLPQSNRQHVSWTDFFITERLQPQLSLAMQHRKVSMAMAKDFDRLFSRLPSWMPPEPPSLVHGDLWSGNVLCDEYGEPWIVDPAAHYGHREADLAMTQLFGGFDPAFLESYHEAFPLMPGIDERLELYNLYPLLVHVNLFGGGYASQVNSILRRFVS